MKTRALLFLYAGALLLTFFAERLGFFLTDFSGSFLVFAPAHFSAGLSVGVFVLLICSYLGVRPKISYCIAAIFVIGTAWEIWEYAVGFAMYPEEILDLMSDYLMDFLGAISAFIFLRRYSSI